MFFDAKQVQEAIEETDPRHEDSAHPIVYFAAGWLLGGQVKKWLGR